MPLTVSLDYYPPDWLPNGHFQSIYPALFRKITAPYTRERINTPDADFLDLDWAYALPIHNEKKAKIAPKTLVILSHGLEGNSTRQYIVGMVRLLTVHGFDCLAWNFRSCSGEINRQLRFYHSGATDDLHTVVQHALARGYQNINLIGFSLGGNMTLKYLGERGAAVVPQIKKAAVFSVPMDLMACSLAIEKPACKPYLWRFLRSLAPKVKAKHALYPADINISQLPKVKTFVDFDHYFTGPIHGFAGAQEYYDQNSSKRFAAHITVPTLIVNAENDPMVPPESLPQNVLRNHPVVTLEIVAEGGHCGFRPDFVEDGAYWSEWRALDFFQE